MNKIVNKFRQHITKRMLLAFTAFFFHMGAHAQEYTYGPNGNLFSDINKQIESIHYNCLNLVDTIVFEDGWQIIYTYTAAGTKLGQQVLLADGTPHKRRDYVDGFLYNDSVLQEIKHTHGRLVPITQSAFFEHQYHITDHLGNVRSTITSLALTTTYTATMESSHAEQEERLFTGLRERRFTFPDANTTPGGEDVVRLMNNAADGVSINIPVKSGDTLNLSVNAYYGGSPDEGQPAGPGISSMLMMALSAMTGGLPVGGESQGAMLSSAGPAAGTALENSSAETIPVAHLNYVLMDRNNIFVDGGFVAVTQAAATSPELLEIDSIYIRRSGILRVFISNTSEQAIPVYFDDLKVEHILTPEIQADSYYPFGMTLVEQHDERSGEVVNLNLFNGKELQLDTILNWYDYGARMYDPALGKWQVVDPKAAEYQSLSPYNYVMNNPLKHIDPDGRGVHLFDKDKDQREYVDEGPMYLLLAHSQTGLEIVYKLTEAMPAGDIAFAFDDMAGGDFPRELNPKILQLKLGHISFTEEDNKIVSAHVGSFIPDDFAAFKGMVVDLRGWTKKEVKEEGSAVTLVAVQATKNLSSEEKAVNLAVALKKMILKTANGREEIASEMKSWGISEKKAERQILEGIKRQVSYQLGIREPMWGGQWIRK